MQMQLLILLLHLQHLLLKLHQIQMTKIKMVLMTDYNNKHHLSQLQQQQQQHQLQEHPLRKTQAVEVDYHHQLQQLHLHVKTLVNLQRILVQNLLVNLHPSKITADACLKCLNPHLCPLVSQLQDVPQCLLQWAVLHHKIVLHKCPRGVLQCPQDVPHQCLHHHHLPNKAVVKHLKVVVLPLKCPWDVVLPLKCPWDVVLPLKCLKVVVELCLNPKDVVVVCPKDVVVVCPKDVEVLCPNPKDVPLLCLCLCQWPPLVVSARSSAQRDVQRNAARNQRRTRKPKNTSIK